MDRKVGQIIARGDAGGSAGFISAAIVKPDILAKHFMSILKQARLPGFRLYLRHTAATMPLAAGMSPNVVSQPPGHASTTFIDTSAHVLAHMQDEAVARIEQRS